MTKNKDIEEISLKDLTKTISKSGNYKKVAQAHGADKLKKDLAMLRKGLVKESPEDMEPASPDEKSMAMRQAKFIMYVGEEIMEHLEQDNDFPEWMQNKLSALHQKAKDMHATMAGEYEDDDEEMNEAYASFKTREEKGAFEDGKKAFRSGKKYNDNPHKDQKLKLAWSKGHNQAKARKLRVSEEAKLDEDVRKMSHGRLKFHMNNKHIPHGSYSFDQMKAERDRRLKTGQGDAYKKAKMSMSEEVELDERFTRVDYKKHGGTFADLRKQAQAKVDKEINSKNKSTKKEEVEVDEAKSYGPGHIGAIQRMLDKERENKKKKSNEAMTASQHRQAMIDKIKKSGAVKSGSMAKEEYVNEKLSVGDGMGAWIDDFKKSDAPQFKGKDEKERRDMAIAAYLSAKRGAKNEKYVSAAQRKAVWATKADGGKGHPDNKGKK